MVTCQINFLIIKPQITYKTKFLLHRNWLFIILIGNEMLFPTPIFKNYSSPKI
jgi:hypothetical protein